ncbi:family 16 glycoside hydrolase, partial [Georgenia sp. MJ170]|uniref:family 16 glycoside hydrolase n=1 Tax=Georgenia sunbinii TaxID=3117728 RepID=UPI002F26D0B9
MFRHAKARTGLPAPAPRRRGRAVLVAGLSAALAASWAVPAAAADLPQQEPGVTLRTYQLAQDPGAVCTLREGTTPNVDKLMPTIDWASDEDFGLSDQFITHALANLTVPADGNYEFRMTNDDGALFYLNDDLVIENDGPQDSTSVTGTVGLTEGVHDLRIEHFEGTNDQRLTLEWKQPGESDFEVVPTSALSTEAGVVRVTAPGNKFCEGDFDTPGDGLRLEGVNPNYELVDLRPEGFEPAVSALDFTEDGDLVVVTAGDVSSGGWEPDPYTGQVYILDGADEADGPEDVTYRLVHEGLLNPMGVDVIGDSIFVSERDGLTELVPEEDPENPDAPNYVRSAEYGEDDEGNPTGKFANWPTGGNFHEFAFGLVHDEDYFYLSLSVAIDNGGASTDPQPGENRGTSLRVDRESGDVEYVAGGLRTPNGIGWGGTDGDDLFVMDNQGAWLPSSKLVHIKEGRFFNHYNNPPGPFDAEPVSQPAVWVPQNEIGNSPSAPVQLTEGPFAGHMLFGDVTYGGVQRAFLEEVDGEYQGAVFRHSAGLEAGVNRTVVGPNGDIYVGGIGEGGNWGEAGKLRYGLQKLVTVGTDTFDMAEVRVIEGGFEVEYTQPISEEAVANIADAFQITQWRYVPTASYGGPKIGEEVLSVTDADVSSDATTVTLAIDGLKPGHVVHLHTPRPFDSAAGDELWNTEAWYTLNSLPGYVAPPDRGYYEAEEATLLGGAGVDTEHSGYSGSGFADAIQNTGAEVRFAVTVDEAGTHPVHLRYANGPNPFEGTKSLSLYVNGEKVGPWELPSTDTWKTWGTDTRDIELDAGANTISLRQDEGDDGNVNLDVLSIGHTDICTPADVEAGYTPLFDGTLSSFEDWSLAGDGSFGRYDDCTLRTEGGMGLLWHPDELGGEYSLKLDWKLTKDDNGGVFVGFPDPGNDPWIAVDQGYEIQIDASDEPDRTTGAIYTFQGADEEARDAALNPVGEWNAYEIVVDGDNIKIYLNGALVNDFISTDPARDLSSGHIGLQNHGAGEVVQYRNVRVADLADLEEPELITVPAEQVSLQMFSLIPWVGADGLPAVLNRLASIGLENIEPFGGTFSGYDAESFRALTDSLGLSVPSSHYNTNEDRFDETLEYVDTLGQEYVGSGGFADPGFDSLEETLATADAMDRLGQRSVDAGIGKFFGHNHDSEFTTTFEYEGEDLSVWEILVAETDPELVTFELDVAWAAHAGVDVPALIEEHGDRIELLHIKDATNVAGEGSPTFVKLGEGEVPLQEILAAAAEHAEVAYFVLEYDMSQEGEAFAAEGFEYLTGQPAGEATEFEPVVVETAEVTFTDEPGTEDDTFTVPSTLGVVYRIGEDVVPAGTHPGAGTVTVTAHARGGFELAEGATAEWSHEFSTEGGGEVPQPPSSAAEFHLSDNWRGTTHHFFKYGRIADEVFVGDWDGDGTD